jgi:hypothetical protein
MPNILTGYDGSCQAGVVYGGASSDTEEEQEAPGPGERNPLRQAAATATTLAANQSATMSLQQEVGRWLRL